MILEHRIRHLLEAAHRAEAEGDARTAGILRRMAQETRPIDPVRPLTPPDRRLAS